MGLTYTVDARTAAALVLTPREREAVLGLAQGWSNAQLAAELGLSPGATRNLVSRVLAKWGLDSRTAVALAAVRLQLVSLETLPLPELADG